jgi:hypothetical protein
MTLISVFPDASCDLDAAAKIPEQAAYHAPTEEQHHHPDDDGPMAETHCP